MTYVLRVHPSLPKLFECMITADTWSNRIGRCYLITQGCFRLLMMSNSFQRQSRTTWKVVGFGNHESGDFTGCVYDEFIGLMER